MALFLPPFIASQMEDTAVQRLTDTDQPATLSSFVASLPLQLKVLTLFPSELGNCNSLAIP